MVDKGERRGKQPIGNFKGGYLHGRDAYLGKRPLVGVIEDVTRTRKAEGRAIGGDLQEIVIPGRREQFVSPDLGE